MIDIPIYCNSEWTTIIELEHLVEVDQTEVQEVLSNK